jgi:type IV pilus assembly protein PilV
METYLSHRKANRRAGFSLLEVVIAIVVLTIGLVGMAGLVAQSIGGTDKSRLMGMASTLASEKLEDLNRWPTTSPYVAAGGGLGSDIVTGTIDYYDDVVFGSAGGQVSETVGTTTGGVTTYVTTAHSANGTITSTTGTAAPVVTGQTSFHRRWLIETSPVVNGITLSPVAPMTGPRRVTVLVSLTNQEQGGVPVTFQMSLLRP